MKKYLTIILSSLFIFTSQASIADTIIGVVDETVQFSDMKYKRKLFPLKKHSEFLNNSKLLTGDNSRMHATLIDGTSLQMGANSELTINEFLLDGNNDKAEIEIAKGAFRFISGKINKNGGTFVVKSPLASIGVRGTDFWGNQTKDSLSLALLDDGMLTITDRKGYRLTLDRPLTFVTITRSGISNIAELTDEELNAAASTVAIPE